jgi:hypothetical protein
MDEVRDALRGMTREKATGPSGMSSEWFIEVCWRIRTECFVIEFWNEYKEKRWSHQVGRRVLTSHYIKKKVMHWSVVNIGDCVCLSMDYKSGRDCRARDWRTSERLLTISLNSWH